MLRDWQVSVLCCRLCSEVKLIVKLGADVLTVKVTELVLRFSNWIICIGCQCVWSHTEINKNWNCVGYICSIPLNQTLVASADVERLTSNLSCIVSYICRTDYCQVRSRCFDSEGYWRGIEVSNWIVCIGCQRIRSDAEIDKNWNCVGYICSIPIEPNTL